MEYAEHECTLLYKQDIKTWLNDKNRTRKYSDKDLDLVKLLAELYKDNDERDDESCNFLLDGQFGSLFFSEPEDLCLCTFTKSDETVIKFDLCLEESYLECLDGGEQKESIGKLYKKIYLDNFISASINGRKFLAYSCEGHIFLMDLDTKSGVLVEKWPVDPELLNSGNCCQLIPYSPDIKGAISRDFSLVAVIGPREESYETSNLKNDKLQIRLYNTSDHQCEVKTIMLDSAFSSKYGAEVFLMSLNPYYSNLLYIVLGVDSSVYNTCRGNARKVGNDSDDDDDDYDDDLVLVLFDLNTEQISAEIASVTIVPIQCYYEGLESVIFLQQGKVLLAYNVFASALLMLDAFSLEIIGRITLSVKDSVLNTQKLVSQCESEIAVFKNIGNNSKAGETYIVWDVEVYKIPDFDFSLKNLCRKAIVTTIKPQSIKELMLPENLKDFLKL